MSIEGGATKIVPYGQGTKYNTERSILAHYFRVERAHLERTDRDHPIQSMNIDPIGPFEPEVDHVTGPDRWTKYLS